MSEGILDDLDFDQDKELEYHLKLFIGKRTGYYLDHWKNTRFVSFDFLKMMVGLPWMIYRKMYGYVIIIYGLILFYNWLFDFSGLFNTIPVYGILYLLSNFDVHLLKSIIGVFVLLVVSISCGFFSKEIYLWHAIRKVKHLRTIYSEERLVRELEESGGTEGFLPTVVLLGLLFYLVSETSLGLNTILTF